MSHSEPRCKTRLILKTALFIFTFMTIFYTSLVDSYNFTISINKLLIVIQTSGRFPPYLQRWSHRAVGQTMWTGDSSIALYCAMQAPCGKGRAREPGFPLCWCVNWCLYDSNATLYWMWGRPLGFCCCKCTVTFDDETFIMVDGRN